jgi:hypothetical protein
MSENDHLKLASEFSIKALDPHCFEQKGAHAFGSAESAQPACAVDLEM